MCFMFGMADAQTRKDLTDTTAAGKPVSSDLMARLVFGNFGNFNSRVRENGLGTNTMLPSLGTVIKDPTRQTK